MSDRFDALARRMAQPLPRRGALKAIGGALFGSAALVALRPFRGDALLCVGQLCGPNCCINGICLNASTGTCGCAAGKKLCGKNLCCDGGGACFAAGSGHCCCATGTTPCGPNCCDAGLACLDRSRGTCGCAAGQTTCRYGATVTCCAAGTACPPTATCPPPPAAPSSTCNFSFSDVNLKEHIVAVDWS
jgi:hypothetical protein